MNINKILYKYDGTNTINNPIQEGNILKGRILDVYGDMISLDIGEGHTIYCKSYIPITGQKGSFMFFMIKSVDEAKVVISPLTDENQQLKIESIYEKLLNMNDIEINTKNVSIIKSLIKNSMPLSKESINKVHKTIDRIEIISKLKENGIIYSLGDSTNLLDEEIANYLIKSLEHTSSNTYLEKDTQEKNYLYEKWYPNKIDVNIEDDLINKSLYKHTEDTYIARREISDILRDCATFEELVEKIVFLYKSDVKISIKNLKLLSNIIDGKGFLETDLEALVSKINNLEYNKESVFTRLLSSLHLLSKGIDFSNKDHFIDYYSRIIGIILKIEESAVKQKELYIEIKDTLETVKEDINFILKLNENNIFLYYPKVYMDTNKWSKILFLDKRKFGKRSNNLSIYICIETENLSKVEIIGVVKGNEAKVDFILKNQGTVDYFKTKADQLQKELNECGFMNVNLDFKIRKKKTNVLDVLSYNSNIEFSFDTRV